MCKVVTNTLLVKILTKGLLMDRNYNSQCTENDLQVGQLSCCNSNDAQQNNGSLLCNTCKLKVEATI